MSERQFNGKVSIVTGAARGIGRAIAEGLAREGSDLALCDVKEEWLAETAEAINKMGRNARTYAADVSDGKAVSACVEKILADFGKIDVLVNNAGITRDTLIMRMDESDWDAVLDINLKGTFLFTKAVSRPMMKQRSGAIVNVASVIGLIGNAGQANYAASKAGVIALTKSTAKELGARNIRVNAVAPGFIETKMTEVLSKEVREKMLEGVPLGRPGTPADVANAVVFLAGDASSYITGHTLTVSGGMVM
jgi:3-oxoacyl-[acyl-carrier protein] reductase